MDINQILQRLYILLVMQKIFYNLEIMSRTGIFVAIDNNTLYGSKLYIFILWQKSLDIKIMFHVNFLP